MAMNFRNFSYLIFFHLLCRTTVRSQPELPPYLTTCSKSSPDFNRCMIRNAEALIAEISNGNETLRIPNLNPLLINSTTIKQGGKQIGLNMDISDVKVFGMSGMKIVELDLNMDAKKLKSRTVVPRLEILGSHKTNGNIMVVKVQGEGKFNITADRVDYSYENFFDYETRSDGYTYAFTKSQKLKINGMKKVTFNLENMLGDQKLDTAVNDLLNQYWRELSSDLFNEMSDKLLEISKVIVNIILGVFPVDTIITP